MLKIIFKSAWRQLVKKTGYSLINILGLTIGLSTALLCGLWIQEQWAYDRFHEDGEHIFRAMQDFRPSTAELETYDALPLPMARVLKEETPGVKYVVETDWERTQSLGVEEQRVLRNGTFVGQDFLRLFTFPLRYGDAKTALSTPNQIVINASTAESLFGNENPVGKELEIGDDLVLQVSAVMEDMPVTSSLQYDYLLPFSLKIKQESRMQEELDNWESYSYQIYFQLEPGVSIAHILAQHRNTIKEHDPEAISTFNAHALPDWHLYNTFEEGKAVTGRIENVKLFGIIGFLVLFIACINFINLTTATAEKRGKEIGVRKAVGARRGSLVLQFLGESVTMVGVSFLTALLLVNLLLPAFNTLVEEQIAFPWRSWEFWGVAGLLIGVSTLLAGIYPAFFLTRHSAKENLQGSFHQGKIAHIWGRRALVGTQFLVSIALIAGSLVIYRQIQYGQQLDTGYDRDMLIDIPLTDALRSNFSSLKEALLASEAVTHLGTSSSPMTELFSSSNSVNWPGRAAGENLEVGIIGVNEDYLGAVGMELLDGRYFKLQPEADKAVVLINETAAKQMKLADPLATQLTWGEDPFTVIGVVKDAVMDSPFEPVMPTIYLKRNWQHSLLLRLSTAQPLAASLTQIKAINEGFDATTPFNYTFVEEDYAEKFKTTNFLGTIALVFAGLAIFLSVLGLLGLVVYVAERRAREISIRKILGASLSQLWLLLSQEFVWIILAGGLLAVPLGGYFLQGWLDSFTYRIDLPWLVFGLAAGIALLIALATISVQSLKAALVNPAKRLRESG